MAVLSIFEYKRQRWNTKAAADEYDIAQTSSGSIAFKNEIEKNIIKRFVRGKKILDIGTGTGRVLEFLADQPLELIGADVSKHMLAACETKLGKKVTLVQAECTNLPFENESFDTIISIDLLTHIHEWKESLKEWIRVLRPNGRIIFDAWSADHAEYASKKYGIDYVKANSGYRAEIAEKYNSFIFEKELSSHISNGPLSIEKIIPYGATLGGMFNLLLKQSIDEPKDFERLDKYLFQDRHHMEYRKLLETEFVEKLGIKIAAKFMVILEKTQFAREKHGPLDVASDSIVDILKKAEIRRKLHLAEKYPSNVKFGAYLTRAAVAAGFADMIKHMFKSANLKHYLQQIETHEREIRLDRMLDALRSTRISRQHPNLASAIEYDFVKYTISNQ